MRFIGYLATMILLAGLAVVALITGKYETNSACEAAGMAIKQEAPGILAELAERDDAFAFADGKGRSFGKLRDAFERGFSGAVAVRAREQLKDAGALECAGLVVYREVHPKGFRRMAAEKALEKSREAAERHLAAPR